MNPFFSPDGTWVGFHGELPGLMKVRVTGGTPEVIAPNAERPSGATWGADGTIVFGTTEGLYRVAASGGRPTLIIKPDPQKKERLYGWPHFLPNGHLLYTIVPTPGSGEPHIAFLNLTTLESRVVINGGTAPSFLRTGHLLYASGASLKVVSFDPSMGQTSGDPVALPDIEVRGLGDYGASDFAISQSATLVYLRPEADPEALRTLSWIDRQGREEPLSIKPGRFSYPRISPDGSLVVLDRTTASGRDLWILNMARLSLTQLTDGPTEDLLPEWSPDGRRVFFASDRSGQFDVYSQPADGATGARLEFSAPGAQMPGTITPDGTQLLVYDNFRDIVLVPLSRPDRPQPLLHTDFDERLPSVSPDGRWLAYESNESGDRFEVFVRPFPDASGRREQVSLEGGRYPRWLRTAGHGLEIVYTTLDGVMMAVPVSLSPNLSLGHATKLFQWQKPPAGRSGLPYDVSPIDGRFLMARPVADGGNAVTHLSVVLNALATVSPAVR
jgi:hypothetical protein